MAKDLVKLAFIFAIVFTVLSPTIGVTKAEIVEKRNLQPLSDGDSVVATNETPSRRYGPLIRQPIFSGQDASVRGSMVTQCSKKIYVQNCDNCDSECRAWGYCKYGGQCEGLYGFRDCICYCERCW